MEKKRIRIGLLVTELEDAFTDPLLAGAISGAREMDADLVIMPGHYLKTPYQNMVHNEYEYQHNAIFKYAAVNSFDVLLVSMGTISGEADEKKSSSFWNSLTRCQL